MHKYFGYWAILATYLWQTEVGNIIISRQQVKKSQIEKPASEIAKGKRTTRLFFQNAAQQVHLTATLLMVCGAMT